MKKLLFLLMALIPVSGVFAQGLTLLTFESYSFSDKVVTENGYEGKIGDGFQWGGGLEIGIKQVNAIELIYQRLDTYGYINYLASQDRGNISVNYIMLGGTRYLPVNDKISGFSTVDLGLGVLGFKDNPNQSDVSKFAWGLRLGVRIAPNDRVSFRLHGQLMSAVQAVGGGVYFGTGGAGAGATGYSTFYQWNLGGSVNIRIR
jgi:hypothetical protein